MQEIAQKVQILPWPVVDLVDLSESTFRPTAVVGWWKASLNGCVKGPHMGLRTGV